MIELERMNTKDIGKLSRSARAKDKRELALLDKQVAIYNAAYSLLEHASKAKERATLKKFLRAAGRAIDVGIARRNRGYEAACKAAGLSVYETPKRRAPKRRRRQTPKKDTLAQVIVLRKSFRALPKAA